MDQKSQIKVMKAGFKILRPDDQPTPRIKIKDNTSHEWLTFEKDFKSKAERDRRMATLLVSNIYIED